MFVVLELLEDVAVAAFRETFLLVVMLGVTEVFD